jgi:hypothetical protein
VKGRGRGEGEEEERKPLSIFQAAAELGRCGEVPTTLVHGEPGEHERRDFGECANEVELDQV